MLRNIFLKTVRDHRWGMVLWGIGLALIISMDVWEYPNFTRTSEQVADLQKAYEAFGFLTGEVVPVDTLGGFLTVESVGYIALLLGVWLAIVGVGIFRGEEEHQALDLLLTTPQSRLKVFWMKVAALETLGLGAMTLFALVFAGVVVVTGQSLPVGGTLGALLNMYLLAIFWGAAGVLAGQVIMVRRAASILVGGLLFATHLLNSVAEIAGGLNWLTWVLPSHYYSLTKSLVPGRELDPLGVGVLAVGTPLLLLASAFMFVRRDVGGRFALWPQSSPVANIPAEQARRLGSRALLGSVFSKSLRDQIGSMIGWGLSLAALGAVVVGTARDALEPLYKSFSSFPLFGEIFGKMVSVEAYLAVVFFLFLPVLVVIYALTQVWGWAADEEEGRLEVLVTEPVPRWATLLGRYAASVVSLAGVLAITTAGTLAAAQLVGLEMDYARVTGAVLSTGPLALVTLALGLALATWIPRPGVAVAVAGGVAVGMFFLNTLAQAFKWPDAVQHLSIFHYYGRPSMDGIVWADMGVLVAVALAFAAVSLVGFQRRDIAQ